MAAPLLQAQIDIDAPVTKVWALISDFGRMPQWSPQCRLMKSFGPLRPGARTFNINRRKFLFWPTTCTVTEVIPEKKVAFRVNTNGVIWSYELEPTQAGTRVVESRACRERRQSGFQLHGERVARRRAQFRARTRRGHERVAGAHQGRWRKANHSARSGRERRRRTGRKRRTGSGRRRGVRMCAAAVFGIHHVTVGGQFVGAHTEHRSQRSGQRQVEPAVAAYPAGGARHRRSRPVVAVVPALRGLAAPPFAEHLAAAKPDLDGGVVDLWVTAGRIAGHQPRVLRRRGEQVAGAQVAGSDPLLPRHPRWAPATPSARAPAPPR